jgi:hypothetical protein
VEAGVYTRAALKQFIQLAKRLGVSKVLKVGRPLKFYDGVDGLYNPAGFYDSETGRDWNLKKKTESWLEHESADRNKAAILLNTRSLKTLGLIDILAHEIGHHLSALAEGACYDSGRTNRTAPSGLLRTFKKQGLMAHPESREEVRAETLGNYLLGNKLPRLLQREVVSLLSKLSSRNAQLIRNHRSSVSASRFR